LTKGRRRRGAKPFRIWLNPQALEILRRRRAEAKQDATFVFPGRDHVDEHMRQATVSLTPIRFREHQTFGEFVPHDLRRTGLTMLGQMHCPRQVQDTIANHVDSTIGGIYDRSDLGPQALEWVRKLGDHVETLTAQPASADVVALSQAA
jgi:integrase